MESLLAILIEDNPLDAQRVIEALRAEDMSIDAVRVASREELERELSNGRVWQLALSDYSLPRLDGREAFAMVRDALPEIPFIFVSGKIDEEEAIEIVRRGATDYVPKTRLGGLGPAVRRALKEAQERRHRREAEMALQARVKQLAEADRRKDEFLAMLAHELRNPLAPILSAMQVLCRMDSGDPRAQAAVAIADRQVHHLARLLDDLLDGSRITTGRIELRLQRVDLAEAMLRAVDTSGSLIQTRHHQLVLELPDGDLALLVDPDRLNQVFANLLDNAAKYTPSGGRIEFRGRREEGFAVVEVQDNGLGIAPEHLESIFEVFSQSERPLNRPEGGLGLGLAMVRRLMTMHGGSVDVESGGHGKGAKFVLRLPCAPPDLSTPASSPNSTSSPTPQEMPANGLKVLLVDDNVDAVKMLASLLRLDGFITREEYDGDAAVKAFAEFDPDVALVDIGLPKLDGYQVAQQIRKMSQKRAALIAVTGYGREEDRRRSRESGFDHHLVKPVDVSEVVALLNVIFDEKGPCC